MGSSGASAWFMLVADSVGGASDISVVASASMGQLPARLSSSCIFSICAAMRVAGWGWGAARRVCGCQCARGKH
eukprot:8343208-Lingulodinium_polyedra.AAC.1